MIELPVAVRGLHGKEDTLKVSTYVVDADVPFLCGKSELKDKWKSKIDTENNILEIKTDGKRKNFKMIGTRGNHVALEIEKRDLEGCRDNKDCYICDQCSNQYENREDLEDHKERRHTKECEEKWVYKDEGKQQKREENRSGIVCNLCEEKFENKSELKEHWETDHESPVYRCIHLECENRYTCQEKWREHMKEKHRIGFYCELCDEYCLFQEELEEHMDSHATETECEEKLEEYTEIECVQCKQKFGSEDEITEHEESGQECDQCEEWLCYGTSLARHKKREHEINREESKEEEDMEIHVMEAECREKPESVNKDINEDECDQCGKWLDCGTSLRKHMKKEHGNTSEQDIKTEENKKENNEDKGKSETGIKIGDLSNQPN